LYAFVSVVYRFALRIILMLKNSVYRNFWKLCSFVGFAKRKKNILRFHEVPKIAVV
jgi:hypothetical protein